VQSWYTWVCRFGPLVTHEFSIVAVTQTQSILNSDKYSPYSIGEKISHPHTFPLFLLFVLVTVALLIAKIFDEIVDFLHTLVKACFGSLLARSEFYQDLERFLFNTICISYSRAVRRGIIKGLATYNILQNPRYKEVFAISDDFALAHSRVKSLRNFGRISFEGMQALEDREKDLRGGCCFGIS
jgi:hypothetical protein